MNIDKSLYRQKIRTRMFTQFLVSSTCIMIFVGVVVNYFAYSIIKRSIYREAETSIRLTCEHFKEWVDESSNFIKFFGEYVSGNELTNTEIENFILYLYNKEQVNVPFVAFPDGTFISPLWKDIEVDIFKRPWYVESVDFYKNRDNFNKLYFSTPYPSKGDGKMVFTICAPIIKNNTLSGIAGLDVYIRDVEDNLELVDDFKGSGFLVSSFGVLLATGQDTYAIGKNVKQTSLKHVYRDFLIKEREVNTTLVVVDREDDSYFFVRDIKTGWVVFFKLNNKELTEFMTKLNWVVFLGALIIIVVFSIVILLLAKRFTEPIVALAQGAGKIAKGDFDIRVRTDLKDELGYLADSFNVMADGLREREQMKKTQIRLDTELQAGQNIQLSVLPEKPIQSELFSSFALYSSAREVGGDFYDYFVVNDECIVFSIGDVSGKGIPAAMFMTMTCTLLRSICPKTESPDEALTELNNSIASHNDENMFVTIFLVYYNPLTGLCKYANGGHNPPFLLTADKIEEIKTVKGMLVGGFVDVIYKCGSFKLEHGDTVVLYTDGITEAQCGRSELYGEERLQAILAREKGESVDELCRAVVNDVKEFQGVEQFDDITLLIWRRK